MMIKGVMNDDDVDDGDDDGDVVTAVHSSTNTK